MKMNFMLLCIQVVAAAAEEAAPWSGASFTRTYELEPLPSPEKDEADTISSVQQLLPNFANTKTASACEMGDAADKAKCLSVEGRECMWTKLTTRNPLLPVQTEKSYCLPCEIDGAEIPCWRVNSWVADKQVLECEMKCPHQKKVREVEHACSDETGFISLAQCFDKGTRTKSKCMHMTFDDGRSQCAPCALKGVGGIGCPAAGEAGPGGATVSSCLSQCDVICTTGPPDCAVPILPPPLPIPPSPGLPRTALANEDEMVNAPLGVKPIPPNPYATAIAAQKAAQAAGYNTATTIAPQYTPVIIYRAPPDYAVSMPYPPPSLIEKDSTLKQADKVVEGTSGTKKKRFVRGRLGLRKMEA